MVSPEPTHPATPSPKPRESHLLFWIIIFILIVLAIFLTLYYTIFSSHKHITTKPTLVVLGTAIKSNIPVFVPALGTVTATNAVTVRTQINGQLLKVYFREGQDVNSGDLLAEIDARPYQAQLLQYEGQLARDQALLANAEIDLKRYKKLYPEGVSQQVYDTQKSLVIQYTGAVKYDLGQIEVIKVNLSYCRITSPIDGQIGLRLVDPGNFVQTSDVNGLAIINTINPITVIFSIPEDNVPAVLKKVALGKPLVVNAYDRNQNQLIESGELLTMDNQIDTTTGTVKLKALFKNYQRQLFPNQFVNIKLRLDTLYNVISVPTAAIQNGTQGTFIYLVNSNHTVTAKPVTVGITEGDKTVITHGIGENNQVVIEGADKLDDGAAITVTPKKSVNPPKNGAS